MTRPKTIPVIGGLYIGCGALVILGSCCLLAMGAVIPLPNEGARLSPGTRLFTSASLFNFLTPILAVLAIAVSVAFLRQKPWSRRAMELIAWAALLYDLISGVLSLQGMYHLGASLTTQPSGSLLRELIPTLIFSVVATLALAVPISAIIVILRTPAMRAAYTPARPVPQPARPPANVATTTQPANPTHSTSPDGRFELRVETWEAGPSRWVSSPEFFDRHSGISLFRFQDPHWSLDQAAWESAALVRLTLRKYPGNHQPAQLSATIDCANGTAWLPSSLPVALGQLEELLDWGLTWK